MRTRSLAIIAAVAVSLPQLVHAQAPVRSAAGVKWGAGPDFLPKGARIAVLQGDPSKSGGYTLRLRFPNGYRIPPHFHPADENVTMLSGTFLVGMGDTLNVRHTQRLSSGGFITVPANAHHFAVARGVTVVQVQGEGPFSITYAKDSDDPRNAKPKH
jgi:quercetin dioxygenase-like cupin family protein